MLSAENEAVGGVRTASGLGSPRLNQRRTKHSRYHFGRRLVLAVGLFIASAVILLGLIKTYADDHALERDANYLKNTENPDPEKMRCILYGLTEVSVAFGRDAGTPLIMMLGEDSSTNPKESPEWWKNRVRAIYRDDKSPEKVYVDAKRYCAQHADLTMPR